MDRRFFTAILGITVLMNCAPRTTVIDTKDLPDTYHCEYMKETCNEAQDFQMQYSRMSPEEQKEAKNILNAYIDQCADAQELCKKSGQSK